ncbi:Shedu immune nuclease family protein [Streptomyces sp. NPDC023998]|uniref:Shedu immune nuclease family protein n=1 Tax=Streptomyces sp. NPDC023998 TaxID=3154597 RepID=UPI003408E2BC
MTTNRTRHLRVSRAAAREAFALAGGRCSFPGCPTPRTLDNGLPLLEIAYIASPVPGGPRYLNITSSRDAADQSDNIIVLCPTHHALVDSNWEAYPVKILRQMREGHLERVNQALDGPRTATSRLTEALEVWERERCNTSEEYWQKFFAERPEALAIPLEGKAYSLLSKCYVGGKTVTNAGGNVLDFLALNSGNCALLEIKTPSARLLTNGAYRTNAFAPSRELSGSCVQVLTYRDSLIRHFTSLAVSTPDLRAVSPPCTVLIGDLESEKMSGNERHSFELFRSALKDVRVLTYDELFTGVRMVLDAIS